MLFRSPDLVPDPGAVIVTHPDAFGYAIIEWLFVDTLALIFTIDNSVSCSGNIQFIANSASHSFSPGRDLPYRHMVTALATWIVCDSRGRLLYAGFVTSKIPF